MAIYFPQRIFDKLSKRTQKEIHKACKKAESNVLIMSTAWVWSLPISESADLLSNVLILTTNDRQVEINRYIDEADKRRKRLSAFIT